VVAPAPLFFLPNPDAGGAAVKEISMLANKKPGPLNACAIAVNEWIQEVEETHEQIRRELENIRFGRAGENQHKAVDQIMGALRRLRTVAPTPRMITAWVFSDAPPRWN